MNTVPMFPLSAVLFPHTPLLLRIFEPRYLTMIGRLLEEDDPQFGVVLIERGHEAGGGDQRSARGTMARLVEVTAGAEDLQIVTVGGDRFTVDEWDEDDPYPQASITRLEGLEWNDDLLPLRTEAERIVRRVLARATEYGTTRWDADVELSDDHHEAIWQLAEIAPLGEFDRFALQNATTAGGLLREIIDRTLEIEPLLTAAPIDDIEGLDGIVPL